MNKIKTTQKVKKKKKKEEDRRKGYQGFVHRQETMWRDGDKVGICKPRREVSKEINFPDTSILDFQARELWEDIVLFV